MARWTGTWLTGLGSAGVQVGSGLPRGADLGLPLDGRGSVAPYGVRSAAFAVDAVLCGLVARLLFPVRDLSEPQTSLSLAPVAVLAIVYLVGLLLSGQTPGMRLLRLRVVLVRGGPAVGLVPAALRTALLMLLVPAVITDRNGRGLHDRAAGTVVVRA